MIAHLRGQVVTREPGAVVLDVGGVGYLVHITPAEAIPARGEDLELHTSLQVREDAMTLYGFGSRRALDLFELLLSSSGVGPKLALAALATHRPEVLTTAIAAGDLATLATVPGIGRKVAQRLVLELKDKLAGLGDGVLPTGEPLDVVDVTAAGAVHGAGADVRSALFGLGYAAGEVEAAMRALGSEVDELPSDELLRGALRTLAAGARS